MPFDDSSKHQLDPKGNAWAAKDLCAAPPLLRAPRLRAPLEPRPDAHLTIPTYACIRANAHRRRATESNSGGAGV